MIENILSVGQKTGFSAVDVFREKVEKKEFSAVPDYPAVFHAVSTDRVSIRAFWETGDPVGFLLSQPEAGAVKTAFSNIYSLKLPGEKENYAALLPSSAEKVKIDIFDGSIDELDSETFAALSDSIAESVVQFPGLKTRKIHLTKTLKKVYAANSKGLNIKYRKTGFKLTLSFALGNNRVDISESKVFFSRLEPFKIISRAYNLLNSLTAEKAAVQGDTPVILAPEASAFILKEFSGYFKIDGEKKKVEFSFPAILNIVDDPLLDRQVGSVPFDDEGVQGRERYLVRKGVIAERISNIQSAYESGVDSSGNGFRNEHSIFPGVRFSNLYIKPTVLSLHNLMKDARQGLLVSLLRLKSMDRDSYLFSAYGYRFEGNELCEPVHFYFRTSYLSYFLNILKISKEQRFFHSAYNTGSPYIMLEASYKSPNLFEI